MIKWKLVLALILVQSILTFGQKQVVFHVVDSNTKKDLAFANIFLEKNKLGDATDLTGIACIKFDLSTIKIDSVKCSYVGYEESYFQIDLEEVDTIEISLRPKYIALKEVVVVGNNTKLTGKELVKAAIKNIKRNYLEVPSNLKAFYREQLLENGKNIELNEAICTFYYTKYPQKGYVRKSFKDYWSTEFSEKFKAKKTGIHLSLRNPQFFKYYNTNKDKCYVHTSAISNNLSTHDINTFIEGGPLSLTAIDKVKYLADFFDNKLINQYQYFRKETTYIDDVLCFVISFKPKMILKSVFQGWHKKVRFPLYSGTIFISTEDFAIVRFESQFSSIARMGKYQMSEPWQIFPKSIAVSVDYTKNLKNKWHLKSVHVEQVIKRNSSLKYTIPEDYKLKTTLLISEVKTENVQDFESSNKHLLKDMSTATLRNFRSTYKEMLWQEYKEERHYPYLTKGELEELEIKYSLEQQFKSKR